MTSTLYNRAMLQRLMGCLLIWLFQISSLAGQQPQKPGESSRAREIQLTFDKAGHLLNSTQCFSKDDQWIVFDGRNLDTPIPANGKIAAVNIRSKEIKTVYQTDHPSEYGPGVGAATFNPAENIVLFIHGLRNCNQEHPYSFSRRTGVCVPFDSPGKVRFLDARNIDSPFTAGALRGGTHAHSWSGDGKWVSFTYNDYLVEQLSKKDSSVMDIRVVAVMNRQGPVSVPHPENLENNPGEMFSAVVTAVIDHPVWGSDQVDKAFDEGWIGTNGYRKKDGSWQQRAIAFQGNVKDSTGRSRTEVFVVDIPDDITKAVKGCPLEGSLTSRPCVPAGVSQRRISFTAKGLEGPRFWLRTTPDGKWIAYLASDRQGITQVFLISPNGGKPRQLSHLPFPIEGPFNFSPDGKMLAYIANHSVFMTSVATGTSKRLTVSVPDGRKPVGAVIWSNNGKMLSFNRYIRESTGESWLQIFLLVL